MKKSREQKMLEIKSMVKLNFDSSLKRYEAFEKKSALFKTLTKILSAYCGIRSGMKVVDIGAGSGISTLEISKLTGGEGFVYGIDISPVMLGYAGKKRIAGNIEYVCGDAEELSKFIKSKVNMALFSASIFLIPNIKKSLKEVKKILSKGGIAGATYLKGVYLDDGRDFFEELRLKTNIPVSSKRVLHTEESIESEAKKIFAEVEKTEWNYPLTISDFKSFFSTEAPSASIFPRLTYFERLIKILEIVKIIKELKIPVLNMKWVLIKGRRDNEVS